MFSQFDLKQSIFFTQEFLLGNKESDHVRILKLLDKMEVIGKYPSEFPECSEDKELYLDICPYFSKAGCQLITGT